VYAIVNTADTAETNPAGPAALSSSSESRKRIRSANKSNPNGPENEERSQPLSTVGATSSTDSAEGFTPTWREESEARIERRRDVVATYTGGNGSSSQVGRGPFGSVGENSGTNLIPDEEEERK
jgi:hypothetical protein